MIPNTMKCWKLKKKALIYSHSDLFAKPFQNQLISFFDGQNILAVICTKFYSLYTPFLTANSENLEPTKM